MLAEHNLNKVLKELKQLSRINYDKSLKNVVHAGAYYGRYETHRAIELIMENTENRTY